MKRAILALLVVAAGASQASAQGIVTLPGHTYVPGAFRVLSTGATGCPLTSCFPLSAAPADDGTWCVCDSVGSWVAAGGTGAGLSASGTVSDSWLVNSDAAAGAESAGLVLLASVAGTTLPVTLRAVSTGAAVTAHAWVDHPTLDLTASLHIGAPEWLSSVADTDAALYLWGHQSGDGTTTATEASFVVDSSADELIITPPAQGTHFVGSLHLDTALAEVDGRDVSADGAKLDLIESGADVTDAANVAAAGARMDTDCDAADTVLACSADDTPTVLDAAGMRALVGMDGMHRYLGFDSVYDPGAAEGGTMAMPLCDGTDCHQRITLTADTATLAGCRAMPIESWVTNCDETTPVAVEYRVGATGTPEATLVVFDSVVDASPCYTGSAGTSTTWATLSVSRATLAGAGCSPAEGIGLVCLLCSGDTDETCDARTVLCDLE